MRRLTPKYWREWRQGVMIWLIGVAGCFTYLHLFPEKQGVNQFLMLASGVFGVLAAIDPLLHTWLIRHGLRSTD